MAASHKGIIWPRATTAESGSSSRIIVMWPAATNKKLALANTFEEVFVCGLGPQARSSKPYGLNEAMHIWAIIGDHKIQIKSQTKPW